MATKPSYLGLLNAIALAECRAHAYLTEWIAHTDDPDVKCVLSTVAAREGEHGMSFAKRINELGYSVLDKPDDGFAKRMDIVRSDCSDLEKMKALGLQKLDSGDKPDVFDKFFTDHSIDIATGELLGRYICEERDSARLLRSCFEQLKKKAKKRGEIVGDDGSVASVASLETKIDALSRSVDELRQIVCAQSMPASAP